MTKLFGSSAAPPAAPLVAPTGPSLTPRDASPAAAALAAARAEEEEEKKRKKGKGTVLGGELGAFGEGQGAEAEGSGGGPAIGDSF